MDQIFDFVFLVLQNHIKSETKNKNKKINHFICGGKRFISKHKIANEAGINFSSHWKFLTALTKNESLGLNFLF